MKHKFIMSSSRPSSNSDSESNPKTDLTVPSQSNPPHSSQLVTPSLSSQDSQNSKNSTPSSSSSGSNSKLKTMPPPAKENPKLSPTPIPNSSNLNLNSTTPSSPQQSEKRPHSSRSHPAPQATNDRSNSDSNSKSKSNSSLPPPPAKTSKSYPIPLRSPPPANSKSNSNSYLNLNSNSYPNSNSNSNSNPNTNPNTNPKEPSPPFIHRPRLPPPSIDLPILPPPKHPKIDSLTPILQTTPDITPSPRNKPLTTLPIMNDHSKPKMMTQPLIDRPSNDQYNGNAVLPTPELPAPTNKSENIFRVGGIVIIVFLIALAVFLKIRKSKKESSVCQADLSSRVGAVAYKPSRSYAGAPPIDPFHRRPRTSTSSQTHSTSQPNPNGSSRAGHSPATPSDNTSARANFSLSFSYEEITDMTGNFSRENLIGEGGFGWVYKGWMPDGGCVAVKQLKVGTGQGEMEFRAEVEIISRIHHRHLVSLIGGCVVDHHRMLVYEFVPNNTLEYHLHGKGVPAIDWEKREKISIGAARGLAYLHEDCHPRIIHKDIKSANILLDSAFEAQVADFGLARLANETFTHVSNRIMGTFGYLAPECASSGKLTDRSDVFSFGVVLLELITGRKPVDASQPPGEQNLVEWARPLLVHALETGEIDELVDPRLGDNYDHIKMTRMIEVAAACVRNAALKRPRMVQVHWALDREGRNTTDLTNGLKVGQSMIYDGNQYQPSEIQRFTQLAFANDGSSGSSVHQSSGGTPKSHSNSNRS